MKWKAVQGYKNDCKRSPAMTENISQNFQLKILICRSAHGIPDAGLAFRWKGGNSNWGNSHPPTLQPAPLIPESILSICNTDRTNTIVVGQTNKTAQRSMCNTLFGTNEKEALILSDPGIPGSIYGSEWLYLLLNWCDSDWWSHYRWYHLVVQQPHLHLQAMQVVPSGGKFTTNASSATWWPKLEPIQVTPPLGHT